MKRLLISFLKDESGQTSTEYILLLVVVAMIVFRFKKVATRELEGLTTKIFGKAGSLVDGLNDE